MAYWLLFSRILFLLKLASVRRNVQIGRKPTPLFSVAIALRLAAVDVGRVFSWKVSELCGVLRITSSALRRILDIPIQGASNIYLMFYPSRVLRAVIHWNILCMWPVVSVGETMHISSSHLALLWPMGHVSVFLICLTAQAYIELAGSASVAFGIPRCQRS
jgi:hypothetical protein